jgi:hypothetical protein
MLRITVHEFPESLVIQFEGKLAGPLVREAEQCWQRARTGHDDATFCFDLTGVTLIDDAGRAFLAAHASGVEFIAAGCQTKAIVAELTGRSVV